jgi:hypothetical protein
MDKTIDDEKEKIVEEIKILSITFTSADYQISRTECELELQTSGRAQCIMATLSQVRPLFFENALIHLQRKSAHTVQLRWSSLPAKTVLEHPDMPIDCTRNDLRTIKTVPYFLDTIDYRNDTRVEQDRLLGTEFLSHGLSSNQRLTKKSKEMFRRKVHIKPCYK